MSTATDRASFLDLMHDDQRIPAARRILKNLMADGSTNDCLDHLVEEFYLLYTREKNLIPESSYCIWFIEAVVERCFAPHQLYDLGGHVSRIEIEQVSEELMDAGFTLDAD